MLSLHAFFSSRLDLPPLCSSVPHYSCSVCLSIQVLVQCLLLLNALRMTDRNFGGCRGEQFFNRVDNLVAALLFRKKGATSMCELSWSARASSSAVLFCGLSLVLACERNMPAIWALLSLFCRTSFIHSEVMVSSSHSFFAVLLLSSHSPPHLSFLVISSDQPLVLHYYPIFLSRSLHTPISSFHPF